MAKGATAKVTMVVDTKKPVKNIGELTKKIQDMRSELEGTDIGSERFDELSEAIRNASGELKELERNMEGLDAQQKAESFVKMGEGIAGGFAIGQGAMALFGSESEALQELQTRVQGAIAIAMGVRMLAEAAMQAATFKRVVVEKLALLWSGKGRLATLAQSAANWVMTGSTVAMTAAKGGATIAAIALRAAMMAIPIVAIVMGVMSLVSALSSWFGESEEVNESTADNSEATQRATEKIQAYTDARREQADWDRKFSEATTDSERELVRLEKQLADQEKATNEATDRMKEFTEDLMDMGFSASYAKSELDKLGYNQAYIDGLIEGEEAIKDWIAAQKEVIKTEKEQEDNRKKAHEAWKQREKEKEKQLLDLNKLRQEIDILETDDDDEKNRKKIQYAREEALRKAEEIKDEEIKRQTILAINKKYDQMEINRKQKLADKQKEIDDAEAEKAKQAREDKEAEIAKILEDQLLEIQAIKDGERNAELRAVRDHFKLLLHESEADAHERIALREEMKRQMKEINDRYDEDERVARQEALNELIEGQLEALNSILTAVSDNMDAQIAEIDEKARKDMEMEGLTEKEKEKIQIEADKKKAKIEKKRKKIAAAMAIIETYKSATLAFSSLAGIPVVGPALGAIAAAAAVVSGLAQVRQIYAQDVGGGSGGGQSPPAPKPQPAKPATTGAFSLGGGDPSKKPVKAYVVTDEMTDSQDQLEGIRQQSTL